MNIQNKLEQLAGSLYLDYFGVGDLSAARSYVDDMSEGLLRDYPFVLSLGITLPHRIVDDLEKSGSDFAKISYHTHAYALINDRLNRSASVFHSFLQKYGYPSYPIPAFQRYSDEKISSLFSHKLGAHLSGLGWIGKSCLLVTEKDGPRVRWISVLTTAPLKATGSAREPECGECRECVDACPANAFSCRDFDPREPREKRYDAGKCRDYFDNLKKESKIHVCGLCLAVCPYGKKHG
jgi:epoxyqueuosine reductase